MIETLFHFTATMLAAVAKAAMQKASPVIGIVIKSVSESQIELLQAKFSPNLNDDEKDILVDTSLNTLKVAWEVLKQEGLLLASDILELTAIAAGTEIQKELGL